MSRTEVGLLLNSLGLRQTRQRLDLYALLFRDQHRHFTADELHRDARRARIPMSLATVYNTLNQFADIGLIRRIAVSGERTYFDTDVSGHQHYYIEEEDRVDDIPVKAIRIEELPPPPDGYRVTKVDVVVHLERVAQDCETSDCEQALQNDERLGTIG
ncbi:MAG: hypothetical protein RLZ98_2200 [Pseudomonadota bacterium]|jgi:Fur family iron response transcriptional regulator